MKNIVILMSLIFSLLGGTSCSKKEVLEVEGTIKLNSNTGYLKADVHKMEKLYSYQTFYYNPQCGCLQGVYLFIFCEWPASNCLPEVQITAQSGDGMIQGVNTFLSNFNQSTISDYFSEDGYKDIFPYADSLNGVVDSIIANQIVINHFYNSHDSTDYFIGLPEGTRMTDDWNSWIDKASCVFRIHDKR